MENPFATALENHKPFVLGTWTLSGDSYYAASDPSIAKAILRIAYDLGITHFDTAPIYGQGNAELLIGQTFKENRHRLFIATKSLPKALPSLRKSLEKSLKRLRRDYVDLFYIHWPCRDHVLLRKNIEELFRWKEKGLIRFIGVSNFSKELLEYYLKDYPIDTLQMAYNLLYTGKDSLLKSFPGLKIFSYGGLAQGILTGKFALHSTNEYQASNTHTQQTSFSENLPLGERQQKLIFFRPEIYGHIQTFMLELRTLAHDLELDTTSLALAWLWQQEGFAGHIIGVRSVEQLLQNFEAFQTARLSSKTFEKLDALSSPIRQLTAEFANVFAHKIS